MGTVLAGGTGDWTILRTSSAVSKEEATLVALDDGSLLVGEKKVVAADSYMFTADVALTGVTALRLEVLPDPESAKPGARPGR